MIWEIIQSLGLGEQLVAAAALFLLAFYLLRGLSLAGTVGVAITSGIMYAVVSAVVLGFALGLGWLDPKPGVIHDTISSVQNFVEDALASWLADRISEVVD